MVGSQNHEGLRERLLHQFYEAREKFLSLVSGLTLHEQCIQVDDLRGPLIWDLGHAAWFEELWILRNTFGENESLPDGDFMYDNERNHKRQRQVMRLLRGDVLIDYMQGIRKRVLSSLAETDFNEKNPLLKNGFVFNMVLNHELQHREIMAVTLQQLLAAPHPSLSPVSPSIQQSKNISDWKPGEMVKISAGEFTMGASGENFSYDNERPAHRVFVKAFEIDKYKTTNHEFVEFIEAGGYKKREYWTDEGWGWIQFNDVTCPEYWRLDPNEGWTRKNFGGVIEPLQPDEPVCNVSWHEAMAYAKFRGKRLPTEAEWEKAAGSPIYPWGDAKPTEPYAHLDMRHLGFAPVWAYPAGDSPFGLRQMMGNVWEWTATPFNPYEGFKAFPYPEYSEIFLGDRFKILKGASWATSPWIIRNSFRNFYLPHHRNVIAGFRCAR